jgi:hypothetical protein
MNYSSNQIGLTQATVYDISAADLAGANSGQRPDLLAKTQAIFRTPDQQLYAANAARSQLVVAALPVTAETNPFTGGVTLQNGAEPIPVVMNPPAANQGIEWKYLAGDLPNWVKGAEWTNGYPISTGEMANSHGLHMRMDGSQLTADNGLISRTGLNPALNFSSGRRIGILVYAHRLNPTTAIRLRVGTSASNYVYYNWATIENTLVEGWNWLVIHSHDTGQIRKIQTGVTMAGWQVGAGSYDIQTTPATYLAVEVRNMRAPNSPILWVSSIFADGGESVPTITLGFDITVDYEPIEAILDKYGFKGYLAVGRAPYATGIDYARLYKKGWDITGHTGRHQNIGTYVERNEINSELQTAKLQAHALGLHRSATLFASPNGSWSNKSLYVLAKAGFKWHRGVNNAPVTQYDKSVGHLNPLIQGAFTCGPNPVSDLIARTSTLLETYKSNCHFYTHDVEAGGNGSNWPADPNNIYAETLDQYCAWLKAKQDAGLCRVVSPSEYIDHAGGNYVSPSAGWRVLNNISIPLSASPVVVSNPTNSLVMFAVEGGAVSLIEFSYDGATYIPTGMTSGMLTVEPGCSIRITYSTAPNVRQLRMPD